MIGFLRGLIGVILLVLLAVFAVANRQTVTVSLDPLPFLIDLQLYLLVFLVFLAGLLLGVVAGRWNAWAAARRQRAKQQARQAARYRSVAD
uniref:lipopolysaccharide assembly protein LapA domain-containing protein n=1 Tax=Ferrovibrio sp. TaxID=1917215 RepID=UPI00311FBD0A